MKRITDFQSPVSLKTLLQKDRDTACVYETILKVIHSPVKKI